MADLGFELGDLRVAEGVGLRQSIVRLFLGRQGIHQELDRVVGFSDVLWAPALVHPSPEAAKKLADVLSVLRCQMHRLLVSNRTANADDTKASSSSNDSIVRYSQSHHAGINRKITGKALTEDDEELADASDEEGGSGDVGKVSFEHDGWGMRK